MSRSALKRKRRPNMVLLVKMPPCLARAEHIAQETLLFHAVAHTKYRIHCQIAYSAYVRLEAHVAMSIRIISNALLRGSFRQVTLGNRLLVASRRLLSRYSGALSAASQDVCDFCRSLMHAVALYRSKVKQHVTRTSAQISSPLDEWLDMLPLPSPLVSESCDPPGSRLRDSRYGQVCLISDKKVSSACPSTRCWHSFTSSPFSIHKI